MKKAQKRSDCPVTFSLDIFGDRWTLLILRDIMFKGKFSYGEFATSAEKIATNILADRLRMLESEKIIKRRVSPNNKSKFIYRLTEKGIDLIPILVEIMQWGSKYNPDTPRKGVLMELKKDKEHVLTHYRSEAMKKM